MFACTDYISLTVGTGATVEGTLIRDNTAACAYDVATKKLTLTMDRLAAAEANGITGIKSFVFSNSSGYGTGGWYQASLWLNTPASWFPYSAITAEPIGTGDGNIKDFATAFPFVKNDASFTLYKNGTVLEYGTDYTVDFGVPNQKNLGIYFKTLEYTNPRINPTFYSSNGNMIDKAYGGYGIFENPFYATHGIDSILLGYAKVYVSDNLADWTEVANRSGASAITINIAAEYKNKRYWKIQKDTGDNSMKSQYFYCDALDAKKNIHFVNAPALGDTITADYRTDVVAKDANHVFDLAVEITLQEKTS
jgi:hypothetical protein